MPSSVRPAIFRRGRRRTPVGRICEAGGRWRLDRNVRHEMAAGGAGLRASREPTEWFRGAKIEVVQFAADRAGDVQEERTFSGGLVDQVRDCLNYLENLSAFHLQKQPDRSQVRGWVSYPMQALRETLVNAVYHRGYDVDQPEPTKVYLFPDRIEVISYPRRGSPRDVQGAGTGARGAARRESADRGAGRGGASKQSAEPAYPQPPGRGRPGRHRRRRSGTARARLPHCASVLRACRRRDLHRPSRVARIRTDQTPVGDRGPPPAPPRPESKVPHGSPAAPGTRDPTRLPRRGMRGHGGISPAP